MTARCAHPVTVALQRAFAQQMPPEDGEDFADAQRGFLGTVPDAQVARQDGHLVWSLSQYGFLDEEAAPDTVHPALWRHARVNRIHGLFEVTPRIFQVRGFDLANVTFIEGDRGLIAIDALTVRESAAAALALYRRHRDPQGKRRLHTVVYSHSHIDHFGGVAGLVDEAHVRAGEVQIVAPAQFLQCAVSENTIAGPVMQRRGEFQFGPTLPKGVDGQVDAGLGKTTGQGAPSLYAPTWTSAQAHETHRIDGVDIEFQLTPETEAPAEMHFWFPGERALNLAENATRTLHNLCPLRGAQARDALAWSKYLNAALHRYAERAEVAFAQHHWPVWGTGRVRRFVTEQRDLYRWLHDQTVRLMNHGLKPAEIAEVLEPPPGLARRWHARGFYGTVSHNAKAIYQRYLGWYDAHPANLNALPPVPAARKYVEYMGGVDALLARARADYERGEFRWVAEVMKHAAYAHPDRRDVRELAADALEQMGYAAESATWRNAFLLGAREYRAAAPAREAAGPARGGQALPLIGALSNELIFDVLAVRVDASRAHARDFSMRWVFSDSGERWTIDISNGAMSAHCDATADDAHDDGATGDHGTGARHTDVTFTLDRPTLESILRQRTPPADAIASGALKLDGDTALASTFFGLLERYPARLPIVDAATPPGDRSAS